MKKRAIIIGGLCVAGLLILGYAAVSNGMLNFLDSLFKFNSTGSELFESIKNDYFKKISLDYHCYDFPYAHNSGEDRATQLAYAKINKDIENLLKQDKISGMFQNFRFKHECSDNYGTYFTMAGINGNLQRAFGILMSPQTATGTIHDGTLFIATTTASAQEIKEGGYCSVYFVSSGNVNGDYVFFKCGITGNDSSLQQVYGMRKTDGKFELLKECDASKGASECQVDKFLINK